MNNLIDNLQFTITIEEDMNYLDDGAESLVQTPVDISISNVSDDGFRVSFFNTCSGLDWNAIHNEMLKLDLFSYFELPEKAVANWCQSSYSDEQGKHHYHIRF